MSILIQLEREFIEEGKVTFSLEEILDVIRTYRVNGQVSIKIGDMGLDTKNNKVIFDSGKEIVLQKRQFRLLKFLVEREGELCTRDEILDTVWGDVCVEGRTVDVHITALRKIIGQHSIETRRGYGYMFKYGTKIR